MRGHSAISLCFLLLLVACGIARAETVDQAYAKALEDYYAGRYKRAAAAMERIVAVPINNEDLHFNLGCTYFRLGKPGNAIYHFEKSLALNPAAEDARFNLKTVRSMVAAKIKDEIKGASGDPWWTRLVKSLGARAWVVLFLVLWWLTFGILFLLRYVSPGPARSGLIAGNTFVAILALVGGLMLAGRVYLDQRVVSGIVLPDRMTVHEGPANSTKVTFKVHAGLKVRIQAHEEGWVRIRLANGLEGWVEEREIGVL